MQIQLFQAYSGILCRPCWKLGLLDATDSSSSRAFENAVYDAADSMGLDEKIYNLQLAPYPSDVVEYHNVDEARVLAHAEAVASKLGVELVM
jgi:hypothetical protein